MRAGKTVRRVRVISEPITDYIRWEHVNTVLNLEVGEDIRWLPRHRLPDELIFPVDGNDWWLFDDHLALSGIFATTAACWATRSSLMLPSLLTASESVISFGPSPSPTVVISQSEPARCLIRSSRDEKLWVLACVISARMLGSPAERSPI
jgi:hypothetical protein